FISIIYDMEREKLMGTLKKTKYFSIMIDGATDAGTIENELLYVRFLGENGPVNAYLSIQDVKQGTAAGILQAIYTAFEEAEISDWRPRLVGFGSDRAAVNVGCRNALRELHLIAEALEEKVLKPTNLHGALWLPCVHRATKILCDSHPIFVAHFEDLMSMERNPKPSSTVVGRAKQVTKYLRNINNVLFLHFMCDTLDQLAELSRVPERRIHYLSSYREH
ncbi:putative zinc finger protein 862-like, partial [Triplophysa rosa]